MRLYPLKFIEIYKQYIWGGKGLDKLNKLVPDNFAAESWEVACHKDGISIVENGFLKGKKLKELITSYKQDLVGTKIYKENMDFPLLIKFINAQKRLSVQVHPDDDYALKHEGELGKNEAWVILDANDDSELIIGLKQGVDKLTFKKCIDENRISDCLNRKKIKPGDVINIPAGLVHAIGKGILLAEIQQNSNLTYRLYDYNRKDDKGNIRPLHIKKALDVINFDAAFNYCMPNSDEIKISSGAVKKVAVKNEYFRIETYSVEKEISMITNEETFQIIIFTQGEGKIEYKGGIYDARNGDTYLMPASLEEIKIKGKLKFIKTYIP